MAKTKKSSTKKAGRQASAQKRKVADIPAGHWTPSAAGARVFGSEKLTSLILRHVPENILLSKFQCVCRQWREVSRAILQPLLDGALASSNSLHCGREVNRLLLAHFGPIINDGITQLNIGLWLTGWHVSRMRSLIDLPIATCGPGRVVHNAYARAGVSWRDMQLYHPPVYKLHYRREVESVLEVVQVADGVRLGHVYDILVAITSNTKGFSWNEVLLTWPQAATGGCDAVSRPDDADGECAETVLRDYVLLERVHHVLPKTCVCPRVRDDRCRCEYDERKRQLQRIASNKWRVTSKDYKEGNLLVQV